MEPTVEPADATEIDSAKWGATQMPPITACQEPHRGPVLSRHARIASSRWRWRSPGRPSTAEHPERGSRGSVRTDPLPARTDTS